MALEADDEADADKEPTEDIGDELDIDPEEVQMLKQIIKPTALAASHPPRPSWVTSRAHPPQRQLRLIGLVR